MMKKDNDFYQSIYSLMQKKLDYRMDEGVEQDLRKFLKQVSNEFHRNKSLSIQRHPNIEDQDTPRANLYQKSFKTLDNAKIWTKIYENV